MLQLFPKLIKTEQLLKNTEQQNKIRTVFNKLIDRTTKTIEFAGKGLKNTDELKSISITKHHSL